MLLPQDEEFFDRGFCLAPAHDPDEAVIAYCRQYVGGQVLTISFTGGSEIDAQVSNALNAAPTTVVEMGNLTGLDFQSWYGERTMRFSFDVPQGRTDLRIHYDPEPRIYVSVRV